ncbi:S8 family serine peptidase [bacterium]|nr:S8 family serine peptidase [bacterium]
MKRFTYTGIGLCLVLLVGLSACSENEPIAPVGQSNEQGTLKKVTDNYLVEYANDSKLQKAVSQVGGTIVDILDPIKVAIVTGLADGDAAALESMSGIQSVTRDQIEKWVPSLAEATKGIPQSISNPVASGDPWNAAFYGDQWGLVQIDAMSAWNVTTGSSDIRVGVLDTGGSPDHQDLAGKYDLAACRNFSPSNPGNPADWQDRHFHGTHVAGTISTNNIGVAGVAPDVTLVAVKVLGDDGSAPFANILQGIMYAVDEADVDIINMSLGGFGPKAQFGRFISMIYKAVNYANSHGVLVVCSAGNESMDMDHNGNWVVVPAEAGAGMVVSATGPLGQMDFDQPSCYTNYGNSAISVAAPGGNFDCATPAWLDYHDGVVSCLAPYVAPGNGTNWYTWAAGTSMAAPHVSGVAALVEDAKGNSNPGYIQARLQNTADDLGAPGNDPYYGKGRVNAASAVQ